MDSYTGNDYIKDKIKGKKSFNGYDTLLYNDLYKKSIP